MCLPYCTQNVIYPNVVKKSSKKKERKPTKTQMKKLKVKVVCTETFRSIHLYELKKTFSEIVKTEYFFLNGCLDKNGIICGNGSFFVKIASFQSTKMCY